MEVNLGEKNWVLLGQLVARGIEALGEKQEFTVAQQRAVTKLVLGLEKAVRKAETKRRKP